MKSKTNEKVVVANPMTAHGGPNITDTRMHPVTGMVEIWSKAVDEATEFDGSLRILSDEERTRAGRFHFGRDRIRFVARRAFLRNILATYVGVAAREIRYLKSQEGKPELNPSRGLFFNTSHSGGLAVVAVANLPHLGVDIERLRPIPDALDLAHQYFSPNELKTIRSIPESSRVAKFLTLWTRKESYVKAVGAGLSIPLNEFDVSTQKNGRTGRVEGPDGDLPFVFTSLKAPPGFVGAVALSGGQISVRNMTPEPVQL